MFLVLLDIRETKNVGFWGERVRISHRIFTSVYEILERNNRVYFCRAVCSEALDRNLIRAHKIIKKSQRRLLLCYNVFLTNVFQKSYLETDLQEK